MLNKLKGSFSEVLDYIPVLMFLGILTGFGAHTAIFGALITAICFCIFNFKSPFLYGATTIYALSLASANVFLGGKSGTLFALIFVTGIIATLFSYLKIGRRTLSNLPKAVSSGFVTGCYSAALILTLPVIFGQKGYSSTALLFNSKTPLFSNINSDSIIIFCTVLAAYYYLSNFKSKGVPVCFLSALTGCLVAYVYKMSLPAVNLGFENFKYVAEADFGNFIHILLFAFIISVVIIAETLNTSKVFKRKTKTEKLILLSGISNILSSITGSIGGLSHTEFSKKKYNSVFFETILLILTAVFYAKISPFIPMTAVASILAIKCYEKIKQTILAQINKTKRQKIYFAICLISAIYNIILGIIFCIIFTLTNERKPKNIGLQ